MKKFEAIFLPVRVYLPNFSTLLLVYLFEMLLFCAIRIV
jgi:hypothetical protein